MSRWRKKTHLGVDDSRRLRPLMSPCFPHGSSGWDQSQREEDFYYTKISSEAVDTSSVPTPPAPPPQPAQGQVSPSHLGWTSCGSLPAPGLHIPPAHRPRSNSSSGLCLSRPSPLSQSAPSSFWQIHSEHLYQVGAAALASTGSLKTHLNIVSEC